MSGDSLVELQTRVAFQDDAIEQLNRTVAGQQQEIGRLREELARLAAQVRSLAGSPVTLAQGEEPPPPHY